MLMLVMLITMLVVIVNVKHVTMYVSSNNIIANYVSM